MRLKTPHLATAAKESIMSDNSQAVKMRSRIDYSDGSIAVATLPYG